MLVHEGCCIVKLGQLYIFNAIGGNNSLLKGAENSDEGLRYCQGIRNAKSEKEVRALPTGVACSYLWTTAHNTPVASSLKLL